MLIAFVCADKSQYLMGDQVILNIRLINTSMKDQTFTLDVYVYQLQGLIHHQFYAGETKKSNKYTDVQIQLDYHDWLLGGYGIDVHLHSGVGGQHVQSTAIDFTKDCINQARLAMFKKGEMDTFTLDMLTRLHINILGIKAITKDETINSDMLHKMNIRFLHMHPLNKEWKDYYRRRKNWKVYVRSRAYKIDYIIEGKQLQFFWMNKLLRRYLQRYSDSLDGVIVDIEGINVEEMQKQYNFLEDIKKRQLDLIVKRDYYWPIKNYDLEDQDVLILTIKQPFCTYYQLKNIIMEGKYFSHFKPIVIEANFSNKIVSYTNNLKLILAAVSANGAYYLLHEEYLLKGNEVFIYGYFDFIVRYKDILYEDNVSDMTKNYGLSKNSLITNIPYSITALPNKIWVVIKENREMIYISLINLIGNDNSWMDEKKQPKVQKRLEFSLPIEREINNIYSASPDINSGRPLVLKHSIQRNEKGKQLYFILDELKFWSIIIINKIVKE